MISSPEKPVVVRQIVVIDAGYILRCRITRLILILCLFLSFVHDVDSSVGDNLGKFCAFASINAFVADTDVCTTKLKHNPFHSFQPHIQSTTGNVWPNAKQSNVPRNQNLPHSVKIKAFSNTWPAGRVPMSVNMDASGIQFVTCPWMRFPDHHSTDTSLSSTERWNINILKCMSYSWSHLLLIRRQWTFRRFLGIQVRNENPLFATVILMLMFYCIFANTSNWGQIKTRNNNHNMETWQEPASALFSLFNLLSTLIAWSQFRAAVRFADEKLDACSDPLLLITNISAILAINAW